MRMIQDRSSLLPCGQVEHPRHILQDEEYDRRLEQLLAHIPPPSSILYILARAQYLTNKQHNEASWTIKVHYELLHAVPRPLPSKAGNISRWARDAVDEGGGSTQSSPRTGTVDFISVKTAELHRSYRPASAPNMKVDFIIHVSNSSPQASQALTRLRRRTRARTVNPGDFIPLESLTMAICIETKRPDVGRKSANLQLGLWHAAHWRNLLRVHCNRPPPTPA
ncbi:hypothetical protein MKZ38_003916 [Zalerion maritima]|uniref:PD-(D/E)XK nuclease-like domain-containing protein n=1 Tax=Zalerion maritima TaxID=339359 RepID=A0AAD5WS19_9PEZI|nr:hypothetical protein MKZ38_003916 [Zalerion maritima]